MKQGRGFTIVELLIVIVIIAILAAISIVAYTGIQQRANEAAIRSDLSNFAKAAEMYRVNNNKYPRPLDNDDDLRALKFKASQTAYPTSIEWNFDYCTDRLQGDTQYILAVMLGNAEAMYVSSNNSSPKKITLSQDRPTPSPCYNNSTDSAADDAGLTNIIPSPAAGISGGISGYRTAGWGNWTK